MRGLLLTVVASTAALNGCDSSSPAPSTPPVTQDGLATSAGFSEAYLGLRTLALSVTSDQVGVEPGTTTTLAVVVDWRLNDGHQATIVCTADGHVSMYTSTGGGVIGAGMHPEVRAAGLDVIQHAESARGTFTPCQEPPETPPDHMTFSIVSTQGTTTASASASDLQTDTSPLHDLATAVQRVIHILDTVNGPTTDDSRTHAP